MEEALVKGLDELGCAYDSQSLSKLSAYVGLVQKWNQRTNLISRKDIKRLLERHLLDSLSVEGFLNDGNVIDGSASLVSGRIGESASSSSCCFFPPGRSAASRSAQSRGNRA